MSLTKNQEMEWEGILYCVKRIKERLEKHFTDIQEDTRIVSAIEIRLTALLDTSKQKREQGRKRHGG